VTATRFFELIPMTYLYHVTAAAHIPSILAEGLRARSYWCDPKVAEYYKEIVRDEGQEPVVLRLPVDQLEGLGPEPDMPGLEEPLTYTLGMSEGEVWECWEGTDRTWQDCIQLIGSMRISKLVPAALLLSHNQPIAKGTSRPPLVRASHHT
jgi:hypothetical protein